MLARKLPTLSEGYDTLDEFVPAKGSVYLFGTSAEDRSAHSAAWETRTTDVTFVRWVEDRPTEVRLETNTQVDLALRNGEALESFWRSFNRRVIYVDITGLAHHVWAPLLRAALLAQLDVRAVYVEPSDYKRSKSPMEGEIFDLSERIRGISPLPGFASLAVGSDDFLFVALLGFEGTRFSYVLENIQPSGDDHVIPVVGVPGFRPEYPFYTFHGNQAPLRETRGWARPIFVTANCPFRLYYALASLAKEADGVLKVAPIGTKPHALGAVLFAIHNQDRVELVYDHPVRNAKRTYGSSRAHVYRVGELHASAGQVNV